MSKLTQREAVFSAICSVLIEAGIAFEAGQDVSPHMTRENRASVNAILVEGFKSGNIELGKTFTEAELKSYVSGLQSNWIRKDKRLNGGTQYVAKNPGSRAGSGDDQLKAMRALLKTLSPGTDDYTEVQSHIEKRVNEIGATKSKTVVNFDALPEALRAKFGA